MLAFLITFAVIGALTILAGLIIVGIEVVQLITVQCKSFQYRVNFRVRKEMVKNMCSVHILTKDNEDETQEEEAVEDAPEVEDAKTEEAAEETKAAEDEVKETEIPQCDLLDDNIKNIIDMWKVKNE